MAKPPPTTMERTVHVILAIAWIAFWTIYMGPMGLPVALVWIWIANEEKP